MSDSPWKRSASDRRAARDRLMEIGRELKAGEAERERVQRAITTSAEKAQAELARIGSQFRGFSASLGKDPAVAAALTRNEEIATTFRRTAASALGDSPDRYFKSHVADIPPNPAYETNENICKILKMQRASTELFQSTNETTIAFLKAFEREARKTVWHTRIFIIVAVFTLLLTGIGIWWNISTSNQMIEANEEMLERLAATQSDLAAQSAQEREAQVLLIEELMAATQSLIQQQANEQREAIEALMEALEETAEHDVPDGGEP